MKSNPLVTVNILSYNRKDELRNTLNNVYGQDYKNIEVIVVDNASNDSSAEMVESEFPEVHLIRLKKNIGIAGWNEGFKVAKGEYILVLDDDSYPTEKCIQSAVVCMRLHDRVGVVALPVYNNYYQSFQSTYINKNCPNTFVGCGALIKNSIFKETKYFSEFLFIYEHEIEFSMRVINSGFEITFCNDAVIVHVNAIGNRILKGRTDQRRKFYTSRNYILILLQHFSCKYLILFIPQLVFSRLMIALFDHSFYKTFMGFIMAIKYVPAILKIRQPLANEVQQFYNKGNYMGRFVMEKYYK